MDVPAPLTDHGVHDTHGTRMYLHDGKQYDHPVAQAQYGLHLMESFRLTGNPQYLNRAKKQARRLVERRVPHAGGWFYPYRFAHLMHLSHERFHVSLSAPTIAPAVARLKIVRRAGTWYRIGAGRLNGYHIPESATSFQLGSYANLGYRIPRPGTVVAAPVNAYTIDDDGLMTATVTDHRVGDTVTVIARAMLNGVEHVQLSSGEHTSQWVRSATINLTW